MKKLLLFFVTMMIFANICMARVSDTINPHEGYSQYSGWIYADMTFNNGIISEDASYSMRIYRDFGLVRLLIVLARAITSVLILFSM